MNRKQRRAQAAREREGRALIRLCLNHGNFDPNEGVAAAVVRGARVLRNTRAITVDQRAQAEKIARTLKADGAGS